MYVMYSYKNAKLHNTDNTRCVHSVSFHMHNALLLNIALVNELALINQHH